MNEFFRRNWFPLFLGLCLCGAWLYFRPKPATPPARHVWNFELCGIGKPVVRPMDVDGDPEHALLALAVHYECGGDVVNLWQTPHLK